MTAPAPPKGAGAEGRRLWRAVVTNFELEEHERVLLREAVRLVDLLVGLQAAIDREGSVIAGPKGDVRVHPAVVEARQSRLALARVLAVLRLPEGEETEAMRRPQRRAGARGVYQLHHYRRTATGR